MQGRSPEFGSFPDTETIDKGFSEKKIARKREGRGFDNSQIQKTSDGNKQKKPLVRLRQKIKRLVRRRDIVQTPSKEPQDLIK